jgi:uncharacterized integral membrane protein (TIGR00697 family)
LKGLFDGSEIVALPGQFGQQVDVRRNAADAVMHVLQDLFLFILVAVLLISNVSASKLVELFGFPFDGGTLLFPLSYIFGDILTEVYGYARARRIIWLGFFGNALGVLTFTIVTALPPARVWPHQEAFATILGVVPRIVLASFIAYLAGEFSNSFVLAKMKLYTRGRWLFSRTIGSTGRSSRTARRCGRRSRGAMGRSGCASLKRRPWRSTSSWRSRSGKRLNYPVLNSTWFVRYLRKQRKS